ncbi:hypothetical protein HK096_010412, partial [Nowakowskiella sp. JEL0078]
NTYTGLHVCTAWSCFVHHYIFDNGIALHDHQNDIHEKLPIRRRAIPVVFLIPEPFVESVTYYRPCLFLLAQIMILNIMAAYMYFTVNGRKITFGRNDWRIQWKRLLDSHTGVRYRLHRDTSSVLLSDFSKVEEPQSQYALGFGPKH